MSDRHQIVSFRLAMRKRNTVERAARPLWGLMLLAASVAATAQQSGDFTYSTNASGATITTYTGSGGTVTIPDTIDGLQVIAIGTNAFRSCTTLTNATIGNSVTAIGNYAFAYCSNLTGVALGSGVLSIGNSAFYSCTQLGDITLPGHVTGIGTLAFGRCFRLSSIIIPASVTNIRNSAFCPCSNLTSITVESQNLLYSGADGVLFDKNQTKLLQYPGGRVGNYLIPGSVLSIGTSAFQYCPQLTGVTIPENLTNIALQAFGSSPRLTAIDVHTNNPVFASVAGVLFDKNLTTLIVCPAGTVGDYAIPDGVTQLASYAFYQCSGLTNILIPDSVATVGNAAFFGCSGLSGLILPTSITSIGTSAFGASGLRSLILPNDLTNLADSLFFSCRELTSVLFSGNAPSLGSSVFFGADNATVYYLPGTMGWNSLFGGRPTALWQPEVRTRDASFGFQTNGFGFNAAWAAGRSIVVEASTNLVNAVWTTVGTGTLTSGYFYFNDAEWTNHPVRFYRIRSQ
jgi:hypothetical protein